MGRDAGGEGVLSVAAVGSALDATASSGAAVEAASTSRCASTATIRLLNAGDGGIAAAACWSVSAGTACVFCFFAGRLVVSGGLERRVPEVLRQARRLGRALRRPREASPLGRSGVARPRRRVTVGRRRAGTRMGGARRRRAPPPPTASTSAAAPARARRTPSAPAERGVARAVRRRRGSATPGRRAAKNPAGRGGREDRPTADVALVELAAVQAVFDLHACGESIEISFCPSRSDRAVARLPRPVDPELLQQRPSTTRPAPRRSWCCCRRLNNSTSSSGVDSIPASVEARESAVREAARRALRAWEMSRAMLTGGRFSRRRQPWSSLAGRAAACRPPCAQQRHVESMLVYITHIHVPRRTRARLSAHTHITHMCRVGAARPLFGRARPSPHGRARARGTAVMRLAGG